MKDIETIAENSVKSTGWNLSANIFMTMSSFIRTYILARLLSVETFGIYGKALSFVFIALPFLWLGHEAAMLHRAPETEDEEQSAAVLFTLSLISCCIWTILMVLAANILFDLTSTNAKIAFYGFIAAEALLHITVAPKTLFAREINYKRQALTRYAQFSISTLLSISLAILGTGIWALISMNLATSIIAIIMYYFWQPNFRPRLCLQPDVVRYYFRFGFKVTLESLVYNIQERIDDLWTASYFGSVAAGFYTQAHVVARYPLKIISLPIISVAKGTFNALKHEKAALTQSFELVCSLVARLTFFIGGAVLLVSHEFIVLYLGEKWLPLLNVVRIMVFYMMIEPIKESFSALFSAIGHPELALRARIWQLACLIAGIILFSWANSWGMEGVALAVNISILVGLMIMIQFLKPHLQVSWRIIFAPPAIALTLTALVAFAAFSQVAFSSVWISLICKLGLWTAIFLLIELAIDRNYLTQLANIMIKFYFRNSQKAAITNTGFFAQN
ncbi:MAG: oligosaccharide flippase family protein [Anaerolineaceae bacterium]|nr:oligosaccharide flippase family protein [Anaerolineaceae bacterium]